MSFTWGRWKIIMRLLKDCEQQPNFTTKKKRVKMIWFYLHLYPNYLLNMGGAGGRHRVDLLISFSYFCPLLFHSSIYYPCLSSASSISLPPLISLKGFLFPSILVSCLGSFLISIITALFPSGFSCSFALSLSPFILTLQKGRCSSQTSETTSEYSVFRKRTCEWSL